MPLSRFFCTRWSRLFRPLLGLMLLSLSSTWARATHLVGGEMTYTHLGNNQYQITLTVYRDCGPTNTLGTGFDDQVYVGLWDGTGQVQPNDVVTMGLAGSNVSNVPVVLGNPCGTPPEELCIEKAIYTTVVSLPPTTYGWDLIWQRCCRNPSISNLQNFGGTDNPGATLVAHVPGDVPGLTDAHENSAPTFASLPPVAVCANFEFIWDHSAVDADGDELVYSLCSPLDGGGTGGGNGPDSPVPNPPSTPPYQEVPFLPGFSATNPVTGDPGLSIDPATGVITGTPTMPGQYAIGICVSEYRDGQLLNTTMRDFQFNVTLCDPNLDAVVANQTPQQFCIGETITLENNSNNASSYAWDFGVPGTNTDVSDEYEPTFTWPEPGDYLVSLVVNPGWPCADTSEALFMVYPPLEPEIVIAEFQCLDGVELYDFEVNGNIDGNASMEWAFEGGFPAQSVAAGPEGIDFGDTDSWTATVTVENHGCDASAEFSWDAPPNPVAAVEDQYQFCTGLTFDFVNESTNATSFLWDFGDADVGSPEEGTSTDVNPTFTYADTGTYVVTLTAFADYACPDVTTADVEIQYLLEPAFDTPDPDCFNDHLFSMTGTASVDENTQYTWDFGGATSYESVEGPVVNGVIYASPGTYAVSLTAEVPSVTGCIQTYTAEVTAIAEPTIDFDVAPLSGCPPLAVTVTNQSESETPTSYEWTWGDGTTSVTQGTTHYYDFPGSFQIHLDMQTGGYCERSLSLSSADLVEVLPIPEAGLTVTPDVVDILDPTVWVSYAGNDEVDCFYSFGDGNGLEGCYVAYTYEEGGVFTINQTVINEVGCAATATGEVTVTGTVFYAPNSFTPDGDGLNDVWIPVVTGIVSYKLEVFNRWGELVFETLDEKEPWLGQKGNDGQHYCPNGMYFYRATYVDKLNYPRVAEGHLYINR